MPIRTNIFMGIVNRSAKIGMSIERCSLHSIAMKSERDLCKVMHNLCPWGSPNSNKLGVLQLNE